MIKYPDDTPFADMGDMTDGKRRLGIYARGLDIARYKDIDALVLRPLLQNDQLGPAVEIPFNMTREICEEMIEVAEAERPIEAFGQALPVKRVELTTEQYGRLMDLVGEVDAYVRDEQESGYKKVRLALQAVLDLGLEP